MNYIYKANSDGRSFGITDDPVVLHVSVIDKPKAEWPIGTVELTKRRSDGLEIIALSEADQLGTTLVHERDDTDQCSRPVV